MPTKRLPPTTAAKPAKRMRFEAVVFIASSLMNERVPSRSHWLLHHTHGTVSWWHGNDHHDDAHELMRHPEPHAGNTGSGAERRLVKSEHDGALIVPPPRRALLLPLQ